MLVFSGFQSVINNNFGSGFTAMSLLGFAGLSSGNIDFRTEFLICGDIVVMISLVYVVAVVPERYCQ
jgi:hypothetical protein